MRTIGINDVRTHLSTLVGQAARGESFVISKGGKPMVQVTALNAPEKPKRLGFLVGEIEVPDDFDTMGSAALAALFGADAGT